MPHVEIDPPGIDEKPAIAGWLVVASMMQIQHALSLNLEDVVADPVSEPGGRMFGAILMNERPYSVSKPKILFSMALG